MMVFIYGGFGTYRNINDQMLVMDQVIQEFLFTWGALMRVYVHIDNAIVYMQRDGINLFLYILLYFLEHVVLL